MSPRELKPEYVRKIISKAIGLFVGGAMSYTPGLFSTFPWRKKPGFSSRSEQDRGFVEIPKAWLTGR
jgi:hypothetical protein